MDDVNINGQNILTIEEEKTTSFHTSIYPNPTNGIMTISLPKAEVFDLVIYDIMGKLILSENKLSQTYIIPDNTLVNGSYILKLSHAKGVIAKKIVFK